MTAKPYNAILSFEDSYDAARACGELRSLGYRTFIEPVEDDYHHVEAWLAVVGADDDAVNAMIEFEVAPIARRHDGFLDEFGVVGL
jgi:hypothetical protein